MENQSSPRLENSLINSGGEKLQSDTYLDRQGRAAWISSRAQLVFAAYRRDDFADPHGFVAQLGMVLESYPDSVIGHITSPRTGIQRTSKFPPTIAEIVEAADDRAAHEMRMRKYAGIARPPRRPPREVTTDENPEERKKVGEMLAQLAGRLKSSR